MSEKIKLLIEISEDIYQEAVNSGYSHLYDEEVACAVAEGTLLSDIEASSNKITEIDKSELQIPSNATNEEALKAMFPNLDVNINYRNETALVLLNHVGFDDFKLVCSLRWLYAPYKIESEG